VVKQVAKGMQITKAYESFILSIIIIGTFALSALTAPMSNSATIKSSGTIATIMPLHVEGKNVKDSLGRVVLLRGMNSGVAFADHPNGWWNPEGGTWLSGFGVWDPSAVKYNLDMMKNWGCNIVRLHTVIEWWLKNTNNYRQHIKDTIGWAGERGLYVVFEPAFVRGGYGNACQFELPYYPYLIYENRSNEEEDVAVMPNRAAFINYWVSVVSELKYYPNVLFEVYNEPHGNNTIKEEFFEMVQEWINAVRDNGATQILIVQWGYGIGVNLDYPPPYGIDARMNWVEDYPLNDPLNNLIYSFHIYRGDIHRTYPEYSKCWTYEDMKLGFQLCLVDYVLNNLSKPVMCGEIGANMWETGEELGRELAWLNNTLMIFNEWGINYLYYSWTIPAHMRHGCLSNGYPWLPPPNEAGKVFINSLA